MVGKMNFMDRKKCWIGLMTIYGKRYIKILHKNVHKFLKVQSISKFYSKIISFYCSTSLPAISHLLLFKNK